MKFECADCHAIMATPFCIRWVQKGGCWEGFYICLTCSQKLADLIASLEKEANGYHAEIDRKRRKGELHRDHKAHQILWLGRWRELNRVLHLLRGLQ